MDLQATPIGKTVVARVIGKDPSQGGQNMTIDKGSQQRHWTRCDDHHAGWRCGTRDFFQ